MEDKDNNRTPVCNNRTRQHQQQRRQWRPLIRGALGLRERRIHDKHRHGTRLRDTYLRDTCLRDTCLRDSRLPLHLLAQTLRQSKPLKGTGLR
jgi:hypothetical protein